MLAAYPTLTAERIAEDSVEAWESSSIATTTWILDEADTVRKGDVQGVTFAQTPR